VTSRQRKEQDLQRDIENHIALETSDNVARGMDPEEARYAALRKFGSVAHVMEDTRQAWGWTWLETLGGDVRHALRRIRRSPGISLLVVLSLALAFAPAVTCFSVIDRLFLVPRPIKAPHEVAALTSRNASPTVKNPYEGVSYPDYVDLRDSLKSFSGLAYVSKRPVIALLNGRREVLLSNLVSDNYFKLLGLPLTSGPGLLPGRPGIVIAHSLWMREFGGTPGVVGRELVINGQSYTIAGIAAPECLGMSRFPVIDLWIPIEAWIERQPGTRRAMTQRDDRTASVWVRFRPGVSWAQATAEVKAATGELARRWPATNRDITGEVFDELNSRARVGLFFSGMGALLCGILFAVASANVAGVLFARMEEQRHETAVRVALGASRPRLVRQWMVESLLLALLGAALGMSAARALMALLPGWLPAMGIQLNLDFTISTRVWIYAASMVCASALAFGLAPAWRASRTDVVSGLRRDPAFSLLRVRIPVRSLLIVAQVAAAEILLFGAGLVLNALSTARQLDPVYDPSRQVVMAWVAPASADGSPKQIDCDALAARLARIGGVRHVSYGRSLPMLGTGLPHYRMEAPGVEPREIQGGTAGPGFLTALGVRMRAGRDLETLDQHAVLVSASLAHLLDASGNPLGRYVTLDGHTRQIVGVFPDTAWTTENRPSLFRAIILAPPRTGGDVSLAMEVSGDPKTFVAAIRNELAAGDHVTLVIKTLGQHHDDSFFLLRASTKSLYGLGLLALLLTASGLHGVASALFARRSREFALRLALGATPGHIMALLLRGALTLTIAGLILGLCIAVPVAALVASRMHGFTPWSASAYALSSAIVVITGITAALQPAARILKLQPADIVRTE